MAVINYQGDTRYHDSLLSTHYNVFNFRRKLNYYNSVMRVATLGNFKFSKIGIKLSSNFAETQRESQKENRNEKRSESNVMDIWGHFLNWNQIGMDCVIEAFIMTQYLEYLNSRPATPEELYLIISDLTLNLLKAGHMSKSWEPVFNKPHILNNPTEIKKIINMRKVENMNFYRKLNFISRSDAFVSTLL